MDARDACWTRALCARMLPLTHRRGVKVLSNLSARWGGVRDKPGARTYQGREHARGALDTHAGRALNSGYEAGEDKHSVDLSRNKVVLV